MVPKLSAAWWQQESHKHIHKEKKILSNLSVPCRRATAPLDTLKVFSPPVTAQHLLTLSSGLYGRNTYSSTASLWVLEQETEDRKGLETGGPESNCPEGHSPSSHLTSTEPHPH